jgi:DNA-binding transcriptional ArsR family regulator
MVRHSQEQAGAGGHRDDLFKALGDRSRRKMLRLLADQDLPLNRIEAQFRMSRPAVIKHIRVLKACGLVEVRKQGRETIHRLNPLPLRALRDWVSEFDSRWEIHLTRLKHQAEAER